MNVYLNDNKKEEVMAHGIMFHHFHSDKHSQSQGSISAEQFSEMIDFLEKDYNILSAQEFSKKTLALDLEPNDICFTFDDALKCQYDIAIPILKERGINAFFFVYGSALTESPDNLEFYRDFRNCFFSSVEDFYSNFFKFFEDMFPKKNEIFIKQYPDNYLEAFSFYTDNDRKFRYIRDNILGNDAYIELMEGFIIERGYSKELRRDALFLSTEDLCNIESEGHVIGLHSYTHPTKIDELDVNAQYEEYKKNLDLLVNVLKSRPTTMSHPCGRYSAETLSVLKQLDIQIGFCSSMKNSMLSALEIPREDHANIVKLLY